MRAFFYVSVLRHCQRRPCSPRHQMDPILYEALSCKHLLVSNVPFIDEEQNGVSELVNSIVRNGKGASGVHTSY